MDDPRAPTPLPHDPDAPRPGGGDPEPAPFLETERVDAERGARKPSKLGRRGVAWVVALSADALQWGLLPLFAPGVVSPVNVGLDLAVAGILVKLLGWHWAFLPSFAAELVPGVDLIPTWTMAVFVATTLGRKRSAR